MTEVDLKVRMTLGDGQVANVRLAALEKLPQFLEEEIDKVMVAAAERIESSLRDLYERVIRERPRKEGESLKKVVMDSLHHMVDSVGGVVQVGVLDEGEAESRTSGEAFGTDVRGLFHILEEGFGPSEEWGFCPLDLAKDLASKAAEEGGHTPQQIKEFVNEISEKFSGRHGDGIMVDVTKPLFFKFPDFGTPLEHGILPHGGWEGWHVLDTQKDPTRGHWIYTLLDQAADKAAQRLRGV
jgi:hypothetical protein